MPLSALLGAQWLAGLDSRCYIKAWLWCIVAVYSHYDLYLLSLYDFAIAPNKALFLRTQESAVISFVFNYVYRDWGALILGISLFYFCLLKTKPLSFWLPFFLSVCLYKKHFDYVVKFTAILYIYIYNYIVNRGRQDIFYIFESSPWLH